MLKKIDWRDREGKEGRSPATLDGLNKEPEFCKVLKSLLNIKFKSVIEQTEKPTQAHKEPGRNSQAVSDKHR